MLERDTYIEMPEAVLYADTVWSWNHLTFFSLSRDPPIQTSERFLLLPIHIPWDQSEFPEGNQVIDSNLLIGYIAYVIFKSLRACQVIITALLRSYNDHSKMLNRIPKFMWFCMSASGMNGEILVVNGSNGIRRRYASISAIPMLWVGGQ